MRWVRVLVFAIATAGCGGSKADVTGSIGGHDFSDIRAVFHAGPYIFLFDRKIDCLDTFFVNRAYIDGEAPTDTPFVALQLTLEGEDAEYGPGVFSVEGDAPLAAFGLVNVGEFDYARGRAGAVTIDEVTDTQIIGSFDIDFPEDSVSGTFETEYCRNMQP